MTDVFSNSQWIWRAGNNCDNDYTEFADSFEYNGGSACVRISVCGDYTLYINGTYVASNQYGDFEHYKVYDEIDISAFVHPGVNTVSVLGWYMGVSGMRYNTPTAGLIYEVVCGGANCTDSRGEIL